MGLERWRVWIGSQARALLSHTASVLLWLGKPLCLAGCPCPEVPSVCGGDRVRWLGPTVPLLELAAAAAVASTVAPLCRPKALPAPSPVEERLPKPHPLTLPPPIFQGQPAICPPNSATGWLCGLGWSLNLTGPGFPQNHFRKTDLRLKALSMNLSVFCLPSCSLFPPPLSPHPQDRQREGWGGRVGASRLLPWGSGDSQLHHPRLQVKWVHVSAVLRECCRHISACAPECRNVHLTQFEQPALAVGFEEGVGEVIAIVLGDGEGLAFDAVEEVLPQEKGGKDPLLHSSRAWVWPMWPRADH